MALVPCETLPHDPSARMLMLHRLDLHVHEIVDFQLTQIMELAYLAILPEHNAVGPNALFESGQLRFLDLI